MDDVGVVRGDHSARDLLPDVQIFHKAVHWALDYDEFFKTNETQVARTILKQGRERAQSLHDGNGWWRDTAQRLLVERQDHVARPAIEKMAHQASSPLGRLHALHTLDGLHALTQAILLGALQEDSAVVREHAVGLSERWVASASEADDTVLRSQIKALRAEGKSLMPERLEQGLAMHEMADLLAFLQKPEGRLLPEVK